MVKVNVADLFILLIFAACAPVILPARVVQALNLNVHALGVQVSPQQGLESNFLILYIHSMFYSIISIKYIVQELHLYFFFCSHVILTWPFVWLQFRDITL